MQSRRSNIRVKYILSKPEPGWTGACGFITKEEILNKIGSTDNKYFYVVGNRPMYFFIEEQLKAMGVSRHSIIYEAFGVPDDITGVMGWPEDIDASNKVSITVEFIKQGKKQKQTFEAQCTEPILNSLEREKELGLEINNGCRSGECALCRTKLVSGKVFVPPEVIIREIDQEFGFLHPCVSYPLTDIHLDLTQT